MKNVVDVTAEDSCLYSVFPEHVFLELPCGGLRRRHPQTAAPVWVTGEGFAGPIPDRKAVLFPRRAEQPNRRQVLAQDFVTDGVFQRTPP